MPSSVGARSAAVPYSEHADGVRLAVRLQPGAATDRIVGLIEDPPGETALKIAVTAVPEHGRANDALLRLLAKHLRLGVRDFALLRGGGARRKLIGIAGDPAALRQRIEKELAPWLKPN